MSCGTGDLGELQGDPWMIQRNYMKIEGDSGETGRDLGRYREIGGDPGKQGKIHGKYEVIYWKIQIDPREMQDVQRWGQEIQVIYRAIWGRYREIRR
jgi:hypothetical protein